jgi:hypothetical protein
MNKINAEISIFKVFRQIKKIKYYEKKPGLLVSGYSLLVTRSWFLAPGCSRPVTEQPATSNEQPSYLHSQEYLLPAIMISSFASIAIRAASQYSVSGPSEIGGPPAASYVTSLHTLQVPNPSHELKARVIKTNDTASIIFRFINDFFQK